MQQLRQANQSALREMDAVRADFTTRVVPEVTANLQSLNQSSHIVALESTVSTLRNTCVIILLNTVPGPYSSSTWSSVFTSHGGSVTFLFQATGYQPTSSGLCVFYLLIDGVDVSISSFLYVNVNSQHVTFPLPRVAPLRTGWAT